jgi:hypothetical protein
MKKKKTFLPKKKTMTHDANLRFPHIKKKKKDEENSLKINY